MRVSINRQIDPGIPTWFFYLTFILLLASLFVLTRVFLFAGNAGLDDPVRKVDPVYESSLGST